MNTTATRAGGCLCGKVRYTAPATPLSVAVCHCRDCQKQAGSAFSLLAVFRRADIAVEGELSEFVNVGDSGAPVQRLFCGQCGSPILSNTETMRSAGITVIKAGTFDDPSDLKPSVHFWSDSRQPWVPMPPDAVCRARG